VLLADISNDKERQEAERLLDTMQVFEVTVEGSLESTEKLNDSVRPLRRISQDFGRAVQRLEKAVREISDSLEVTLSLARRASSVIEEKLATSALE
jgi:hypothetical protein